MLNQNEQLVAALKAVKTGDLSVRLPETEGEVATVFNALVEQMSAVLSEVNRLNREMTTGKLGGQSEIEGLSGVWEETQALANGLEWVITSHIRGMSKRIEPLINASQSAVGDEIENLEINVAKLVHKVMQPQL